PACRGRGSRRYCWRIHQGPPRPGLIASLGLLACPASGQSTAGGNSPTVSVAIQAAEPREVVHRAVPERVSSREGGTSDLLRRYRRGPPNCNPVKPQGVGRAPGLMTLEAGSSILPGRTIFLP